MDDKIKVSMTQEDMSRALDWALSIVDRQAEELVFLRQSVKELLEIAQSSEEHYSWRSDVLGSTMSPEAKHLVDKKVKAVRKAMNTAKAALAMSSGTT